MTPWPDDKPYKQSPSGMSPARYRELVARYAAGEPIRDLAAEYRVSVSTIYRHARILGQRKRDVGAPTLRKGPAPVTVRVLEGGGAAVICGDLGFRFHRDAPEKTVDVLFEHMQHARFPHTVEIIVDSAYEQDAFDRALASQALPLLEDPREGAREDPREDVREESQS